MIKYKGFNRGEIVQLITDVGWNKKGELAVVVEGGNRNMTVKFEHSGCLVITNNLYYRKVNMESLTL